MSSRVSCDRPARAASAFVFSIFRVLSNFLIIVNGGPSILRDHRAQTRSDRIHPEAMAPIIPNYKQTWGNIRKIASAPEVTKQLTFKSHDYRAS